MDELYPVIRMEIDRMQQTVAVALQRHAAEMDRDTQAAIEAFCEGDNISRIINIEVRNTIENVLRSAVQDCLRSLPIRMALAEMVAEHFRQSIAGGGSHA